MQKFIFLLLFFTTANFALARQYADLVLTNGHIWTGRTGPDSMISSLAVRGDRIIAVGSSADVMPLKGDRTRCIDLNGDLVVPGFNDAHLHFVAGGFSLLRIDLHNAKDQQDFRRLVQEYAAKQPPGRWITGGRWDHESWPEKQWPTKELIDDVTKNNPVLLKRVDGHIALANSLALKLAGIDKNTPDPYGGTIVKDPRTGEPTGILIDNAMDPIYRIIPDPTEKEIIQAVKAAQEHALSLGVTSVQDMGTSADEFRVYQKLYRNGELQVRIYVFHSMSRRNHLGALGVQRAFGNLWLRMGGVKAFVDGSMGAGSALFFQPYEDNPSSSGLPIQPKEELTDFICQADSLELQIALHAIGDKANTWALDAFEQAMRKNGERDTRHRIEHAQVIRPQDVPRFHELAVIASVQPSHCIDDMRWAEKRIGKRARNSYRWHSLLTQNATVAFGTDWPVEPLNPMLGIYAAVTRQFTGGGPKGGWYPQEKITLSRALKCYTQSSAFAEFMEDEKGVLAPGKLADFVVLDRNLFDISAQDILKTKVKITVVGGKIMYERRATDGLAK